MDKHTKALIEENIELIESNDLKQIYYIVEEQVLPIYWNTVFKELDEIFTNDLGLDTIAPRFECFKVSLVDMEEQYAEDVSEGYIHNDTAFLTLLKRYGTCRFGFKFEELVKYVRQFDLLDLHWDGTQWRVHI